MHSQKVLINLNKYSVKQKVNIYLYEDHSLTSLNILWLGKTLLYKLYIELCAL